MSDRDELAAVRLNLEKMADTLTGQLPPHIPLSRFVSCAMTAVQKTPKLLTANRDSLYLACKEAAEDGLLPDGREGAIVPRWDARLRQEVCAWQPMVAGLVKLAWQCGGIARLHADTAYEGEVFEVLGGTTPSIVHRYDLNKRGDGSTLERIQAVYAVAKIAGGETMQAVLTPGEVDKIRALSKSEKGPWKDWPVAMAQVRAVRRLCKLLPLSADRDADARMRRAAERGDVIDGVAEEMPEAMPRTTAPEGGKLAAIEQALDLGRDLAGQPQPEPAIDREPEQVQQDTQRAQDTPAVASFLSDMRKNGDTAQLMRWIDMPKVQRFLKELAPDAHERVKDAIAERYGTLRELDALRGKTPEGASA